MLDHRVAYLDRQLEIEKGKLVMSLYDKRDDFPFRVQNYPHLDSNVPCMPMYGVYISHLPRFASACDSYSDFLARHKRLVRTLLDQGFRYGLLCRIQTVLPVPPFLDPALFPLSDAASP